MWIRPVCAMCLLLQFQNYIRRWLREQKYDFPWNVFCEFERRAIAHTPQSRTCQMLRLIRKHIQALEWKEWQLGNCRFVLKTQENNIRFVDSPVACSFAASIVSHLRNAKICADSHFAFNKKVFKFYKQNSRELYAIRRKTLPQQRNARSELDKTSKFRKKQHRTLREWVWFGLRMLVLLLKLPPNPILVLPTIWNA